MRENRSVTRHWTLCGKLQTRGKRLDERSYEDKIMQDMRKKRPLAEIEEMLIENGEVLEDSPKKKYDNDDPEVNLEEECSQAVKRKQIEEDSSDIIPLEMRHLRESDRKVKENVYRAIADLKGRGMSRLLTNFLRLPDRLICLSKIDQAERFA